MKAMLLRVGMDTGTDGALGPVFPDGSFEYIPFQNATHGTPWRPGPMQGCGDDTGARFLIFSR